MRIFGLEVFKKKSLQAVYSFGSSWFNTVRESYSGAFQQAVTLDSQRNVLAFSAVFACVTSIAGDIAKMRVKIVKEDPKTDICVEVKDYAAAKVLKRPNRYQDRIKFEENWIISKLLYGNTYILKERDAQRNVVRLYPLDSQRVVPLVADDGGVYYQLVQDRLAGIEESTVVPASEIIHDRMNCLFHPLVGISPIFACGMSATMGNKIQSNSTKFFDNMSRPSGMLTAPGSISAEVAARLKAAWEENFSGNNIGRLAVLGDALKYEPMTIPAQAAQLIEQLRWTVEDVARAFCMPLFKLGGPIPAHSTLDMLIQSYYTDCLQRLIESFELCLDEGLGLPDGYYTEFDLDGLLRMDQLAQITSLKESVLAAIRSPNEARAKLNLPPVDGGEYPLAQQQNYSLGALARRDAAGADGATDVQATAMNGAQVTGLQAIIIATAAGQIPPNTARAVIAAAFPLLSEEEINAIIDPLKTPNPALPAPTPEPAVPAPKPAATPEPAKEMLQLADYLEKELQWTA